MSATPYKSNLVGEQLRVVRISPGQWDDPLVANLILCKLSLASTFCPYTALSYVWGLASATDTIYLDGFRTGVTVNLLCALRHLRKADRPILLWVDALCINQENELERGQQVSIMRDIYQNAQEVIVFMGDARGHRASRAQLRAPPSVPEIRLYGDGRDRGFLDDTFRECRAPQTAPPAICSPADSCAIGLIRGFSDPDTVEQFLLELMRLSQDARSYMFECLRAFVVCPWWERIWVVQEVTVSNTVVVQFGSITASWEVFVQATNNWSMPSTRELTDRAALEAENIKVLELLNTQVSGLERTRRRWRDGGGIPFIHLLQEFSNRRASDDRDKVYGLLSLTQKEARLCIRPDYSLPVFFTYRATALALIRAEKSLACWCGDQRRKNHRDFPSWVPDWSTSFDHGDRRRMNRFDCYGVNREWSIALVNTERDYWTTVNNEIKRLLDSLECRSGRLPESLRRFLRHYSDYIYNLKIKHRIFPNVIREIMIRCLQLLDFCTATETTIRPTRLFKSSYILQRDNGGWKTERSKVASVGNLLVIDSITSDCVTTCGSRLLSWADKKSSLSILSSWLRIFQQMQAEFSSPKHVSMPVGSGSLQEFAETLVGGLCWHNGSYRKTELVDLSPLEDWLRLSLAVQNVKNLCMPPSPFSEDIEIATDGRVFFLTKNGSMGLGPASIQTGDTIHILPGGRTHFALRKRPPGKGFSTSETPEWGYDRADDQYELIGDCYLHNDGMPDSQSPDDDEAAIEGSLPFEGLGSRYLEGMWRKVQSIKLI